MTVIRGTETTLPQITGTKADAQVVRGTVASCTAIGSTSSDTNTYAVIQGTLNAHPVEA